MLKYVAIAVAAWLLLSLVLFIVSAQIETSKLPSSVSDQLSSGGNMLFSANNVLIIGTDQRPKGTHEAGANTNDAGSRSDTLMLWRVGGGTSRRLSIPRDTVVPIPGHGQQKINAAYAYGGPGLTIRTVEAFTGVKINHVIIINLAAFPQFIDAIGGIDIRTGRICSDISGGVKNGGFSLNLRPGVHHLSGRDALTLARTRENKCNPAENDLTRVRRQQQILNAVKSQLTSAGTFFRLPWVSWDAPKVLRTDMGAIHAAVDVRSGRDRRHGPAAGAQAERGDDAAGRRVGVDGVAVGGAVGGRQAPERLSDRSRPRRARETSSRPGRY